MEMIQPIDDHVALFFQSIHFGPLTAFFSIFIRLDLWYLVAAVLVLYFFIRTKNLRAPIVSYFLAWNWSFHWINILKHYFHRARPFVAIKGLTAVAPAHGFSFPSGHATLAAAMAVVLACHFPKARYIILVIAFLIGLSRLYFDVHYLSDVLAGFVLGGIIGGASLVVEKIILMVNKPVDAQV